MACTSLTALPKACGSAGNAGGLELKLYMVAYNDLAPATGATGGETYVKATNGVINAIGLDTSKKYVEVGLLKSTAGLTEENVIDETKGLDYIKQSFTLKLGGLSVENKAFVNALRGQSISILFKTNNKQWFAIGLNGSLRLSAATSGTGLATDDETGFNLTLEGIDTDWASQVDPSIISTLIA